jgi:steroid 5-alpha reductase family enzyme
MNLFGLSLAILVAMLVVMSIGWIFQRRQNNGGWTDVFWTYGTGATCAVAALIPSTYQAPAWRQYFVAALIAAWSARLGTYVAKRVARSGEDVRYAAIREQWGPAFQRWMFWLLIVQAPVSCLLGVAVVFAARQPDPHFRVTDLLGLAVWAVSVTGEAIADRQMQRFKADPANRGKVCASGLWAFSRHPNYFFEWLVWFTYPIIGITLIAPWSLLSLLAPALMLIVLFFATGIPPLEAAMLCSKGDAYRRYQDAVPMLVPRPWRGYKP